jgi:hypothetical protein
MTRPLPMGSGRVIQAGNDPGMAAGPSLVTAPAARHAGESPCPAGWVVPRVPGSGASRPP